MYFIGIDNGSQSIKVAIIDKFGKEISFAQTLLKETQTPAEGVVYHPGDDLWESLDDALSKLMKSFKGDKKKILGIGLCTIRCCRVLLDKNCQLAYPVISWMDKRLSKPYVHEDDNVKFVVSTAGYLGYKLTGQKKDAYSNLEFYWPIDFKTMDWSKDEKVIKDNGLKREMLFDIVKPFEAFGVLREDLAKKYGLSLNLPVVATGNDKAVELLGSGVVENDSAMISLGTYISSMVPNDKYYQNPKTFYPTLAAIPGKYVYESFGIRRGMWTIGWYKNLLGYEVTKYAEEFGLGKEEYLDLMTRKINPGSDGLIMLLDWLAPPDKPYRKGLMIGFDQRHNRFHIYRSILEAIAYNIKNNLQDMCDEISLKLKNVVVVGGGSKSEVLMQILSDLFGLPIIRREGNSVACLGSAISVAINLGIYKTPKIAIENMVKTKKIFTPNMELNNFYNKINNNIVKNLREKTDVILKNIYNVYKEVSNDKN